MKLGVRGEELPPRMAITVQSCFLLCSPFLTLLRAFKTYSLRHCMHYGLFFPYSPSLFLLKYSSVKFSHNTSQAAWALPITHNHVDKVTIIPLCSSDKTHPNQHRLWYTAASCGTLEQTFGKGLMRRVAQKSTRNHRNIFRFNQPLPTEADWEYFVFGFQVQLIFLTHAINQ